LSENHTSNAPPLWLIAVTGVLIFNFALLSYFSYEQGQKIKSLTLQLQALAENHSKLLENQKSLQLDLTGLTAQTRSALTLLDSRVSNDARDVAVLKKKLEPVTGFVRRGEIILPE
jgi:nitrogen fixation/metabolism regulation signal transduction histidine kinase